MTLHRQPPPGRRRYPWLLTTVPIAVTLLASCKSSGNDAAQPTTSPLPSSHTSTAPPSQASAARPSPHATSSSASTANAESKCEARGFASGDILVRMAAPGQAPITQELGGEWTWNSTTKTCDTSVQWMIFTAPTTPGNCTQVGYVADNPGYNQNATPAPPLNKIIASKGPAC